MKFNITTAFVALTFLPAIIAAPLTRRSGIAFTTGDYQGITVGTPLTIGWSGNEGAVTITLKSGSADNLETVGTVAGDFPFFSLFCLIPRCFWFHDLTSTLRT